MSLLQTPRDNTSTLLFATMTTSYVIPGALAFVGPPHVSILEGFTYLSVIQVQGSSAIVKKAGPDAGDSEPEFEVKVSVLRHRIVEPMESELWPGSYVGHPIAFIQTTGVSCDNELMAWLPATRWRDPRHSSTTPTVIAADRLNYAFQTGAYVNCSVLNASELQDKQNQVIIACGKSRSGLPASVTSSMLNITFEPDQRVPLIRPDTLEITYVQRQLIVDCEFMGRGNSPGDVFKDPQFTDSSTVKATRRSHTGKRRATNDIDLSFSDTDCEEKDEHTSTEQADIDMARLHNRPLRKRARYTDDDFQDLPPSDDVDVPVLESRRDNAAFRPSQIERQVHNVVVNRSLLGKNAQATVESAQQSRNTKFLGMPPILRGACDISFGVRGLSMMHVRRYFEQLERRKRPMPSTWPTLGTQMLYSQQHRQLPSRRS
ncbi:hypothetical protein ON010_g17942 [Phytophthora cinnamomi]|nr:hypothetical protein ON010_g17942 [Phytophthora cinnamomi]